ncbi:MAG: hypothetical protein F6K24_36705 [Okeania sp. SIO2D1]|nr:hypothetical protein [Okeania sp. SIO2D1]
MKKLLSLLIIASLTPAVLIGCGSSEETASTTQTEEAAETSTEKAASEKDDKLTKDWFLFTAEDGTYSVKFPGEPKVQEHSTQVKVGELDEDVTDINLKMVVYEGSASKQAYLTTHAKYPVDPSQYNAEEGLNAARNGVENNANVTITSEEKIDYEGLPGRELVTTIPSQEGEGELTQRIRMFIDPEGPTLYQAVVITDEGDVNSPEADAFFNSWEIAKNE